MFSRSVELVSDTNIFGRLTGRGTQILVYGMTISAGEELAMVLPLPATRSESAVRFINLEGYPTFFADMRKPYLRAARPRGEEATLDLGPKLAVHDVGSFEASFVPTLADFARLDPRFALPPQTWDALPGYRDWGFAVFKLKPYAGAVHPMAFEFTTKQPAKVYFPTVHMHDGEVHPNAEFDHSLFCQVDRATYEWTSSLEPAREFMAHKKLEDTVDPDEVIYRRVLAGTLPNRDQWV